VSPRGDREAAVDRGNVVRVRLDPAEGSEIRKTRPAVVVSNRAACRFDTVVQIVPITGLPDRPLRPYESRVESPGSGLKKPSRLVANQVRTVSKQRIEAVLGRLDRDEERLLDRALRIQLGPAPG
jgi:mRNA interferase MazF